MPISKILIIEDNPETLQQLLLGLKDWYIGEIVTSFSGGDVLQIIDREEFDIVLMPVYPLRTLLREMIQKTKDKPEAPLIIVTGTTQARDPVRKIEQAGCYYFPLTKHFYSLKVIFFAAEEPLRNQKIVQGI